MIAKIRQYIGNHPRFAWFLYGIIFLVAILILFQYIYQAFTPPPTPTIVGEGAEQVVVETQDRSGVIATLIFTLLGILFVVGFAVVIFRIHQKQKEEHPELFQ